MNLEDLFILYSVADFFRFADFLLTMRNFNACIDLESSSYENCEKLNKHPDRNFYEQNQLCEINFHLFFFLILYFMNYFIYFLGTFSVQEELFIEIIVFLFLPKLHNFSKVRRNCIPPGVASLYDK